MKLPVDPYKLSAEEVGDLLSVSIETGLSEVEVRHRRLKYGRNQLTMIQDKNLVLVFLAQFQSPIVYLLLAAAAISFFFSDNTEGVAILAVILVNAFIGFWMESQAIKSMTALKKLDTVTAKVWREGELNEIPSEELVPGDILFLEAGDLVSADARLISVRQLEADESALTGESLPVVKITDVLYQDTIVADRKNMVFKGTIITRGNGRAVITATGMKTELGRISTLVVSTKDDAIPLNKKLLRLSQRLVLLALIIVLPMILIGLLQERDLRLMLKTAIALAVAAIPEGLPIVATIALARGMLKLAKQNVVVKQLAAVETLGSTNVIFTDKTGTLTQNRLEVNTICLPHNTLEMVWNEKNKAIEIYPPDPGPPDAENLLKLLSVAVMCNNASFSEGNVVGDPLEVALLKIGAYHQSGFLDEIYKIFPRIHEQPFESETKIMGTVHKYNGNDFAAVKGALEEILKLSTHILVDGEVRIFTKGEKQGWVDRHNALAKKGQRILAFAFNDRIKSIQHFTENLIFIGLAGFLDPPRAEVPQSIRECTDAGIQVVMVTGDHAETAKTIALKIGLINSTDETVIHGEELKPQAQRSQEEEARLMKARIFSRVSPGQKMELIEMYQHHGWIVGMTGDGVNDAPALKKAEIGIAMGKRGTQVAREAADMVLQDDSFASIVKAIKYGRVIYDNIKIFIIYLLSCNLSEILIVAIAAFSNLSMPLMPLQILFLNLVTDVFPALALGMNEGSALVMKRRPRSPDEPMITKKDWSSIFVYSFFITAGVFSVFVYSHVFLKHSVVVSNNIAFFSLAFSQLFHPLNLASAKVSFFRNEITDNPHLWAAVTLCVVLIFMAYLIEPFNVIFSLQPLSVGAWILIGVGSTFHLVLIQLVKRMGVIQ